MAVAASFAAPTLSLLIGLGIAFVIQGIKYFNVEQQQFIKIDNSLLVGFAFLTISAIASLIAVPASKFTLTRKYAVFLVLLYVAFVLVSVLTDFKVIFTTPFL
jgi:Ca2+/Na+ antiporter